MKILVTGAKGFVGKNLVSELRNKGYQEVFEYDLGTDPALLDVFTTQCDFVFHLAGVNRPQNDEEFMEGNWGFTTQLLDSLRKNGNNSSVLITSSIQATLDNLYGKSKKAAEDLMFDYSKEIGAKSYVYRLPNLFGKWCKPNYNSAIATFCNNIANDFPIQVNDKNYELTLAYIDDVLVEFINALEGKETRDNAFCSIPVTHKATLGKIVDLLYSFKKSRKDLSVHCTTDEFERKLYATYLSYLPKNEFNYPIKMNVDDRGSFTEILRTADRGQFSVNISKPGITKGNHWHHTKNEKFVVVSGKGVIRFRLVGSDEVLEYFVSGDKIEVVDIPPGYTHNIENLGETDLVTFMWCNECFNSEKPDTNFERV